MKKVKLSKLLINNLSITSGYLTKMEMLLIFVLCMTSWYAIKMEMLLAETKSLSSPVTLIGNAVTQRDNVKQSILMFENSHPQIPNDLIFKVDLALSYFMEKNYVKNNVLAEKDILEVVDNSIQGFIAQTKDSRLTL